MTTKTGRSLEHHLKAKRALELRVQGLTWQQIADQTGYSNRGNAYQAAMKHLKDIPREAAEEAREMELQRLDSLQNAVWRDAMTGDVKAVERALKVVQERSKLLGLYGLGANDDGQRTVVEALAQLMEFAKGTPTQ